MVLGNSKIATTLAVTDIDRAKDFYGKKLGLKTTPTGADEFGGVTYEAGGGTHLYVYERPTPSGSTATCASFEVDDVEKAVKALQQKGVTFEEYDIPEMGITTKNGVATMGDFQSAWFKDPDGNILAIGNSIHSKTGKRQATKATA